MRTLYFVLLMLTHLSTQADPLTFSSQPTKTPLLELYSSQGCSSCPPAERWISRLKSHPQLWTTFVPLVFHVDYWNYLGWTDPFSNTTFSTRQRMYHSQGFIRSVYTPGLIFNGQEWRGWIFRKEPPRISQSAQILTITLDKGSLTANYASSSPLQLNIALLGMGIKTDVKSGENKNKQFTEDFVVLRHYSKHSNNGHWKFSIETETKHEVDRYAIAAWINSPGSVMPIQSTGHWLN